MKFDPIVLHLGSNCHNRLNYLKAALLELEKVLGKPIHISQIYETAAWGVLDQSEFLNMAVVFNSVIKPYELLKCVKHIETKLGRKARQKWHEREIDIDIIFYGSQKFNSNDLVIPHPQIVNRKFVLIPLYEMIPNFIHPLLNKTIIELLEECKDSLKVELWQNK